MTPRDHSRHPAALAPAYKSTRLRAPSRPLIKPVGATDLGGPTFGSDDIGPDDHNLLVNFGADSPVGERIILHGTLRDADGRPIPHSLIEIWQANAAGRYRHANDDYLAPLDPNFGGCGRTVTDAEGRYRFLTVKPGAYPWPNGPNSWRPAHVHFSLFGHSFEQRLITQTYFEGDPLIGLCPIAQSLPDPGLVDSLISRLDMDETKPHDAIAYRFDIVLRGRNGTMFETREGM